ncbi:MAG: minor capsid protein [Patescibacteria group bacterium]|nr:minor capsid protein [Patescibacteria group bacterium]
MQKSLLYWLRATYRANPPRLAEDETPAETLRRELRRLRGQWEKRFREEAERLARRFAKHVREDLDRQFTRMLKDHDLSVEFRMTAPMRDIMQATISQQVGLIRSIPEQHLAKVETLVMQSVQTGRDLGQLTTDLQQAFGVTKRRAALIAKDQNDKATASMTRARQVDLGITEAIWLHSHGGKKPRPKHLAFNGKRYSTKTGAPIGDNGQNVFPGEEINCRCRSRSILAGLTKTEPK